MNSRYKHFLWGFYIILTIICFYMLFCIGLLDYIRPTIDICDPCKISICWDHYGSEADEIIVYKRSTDKNICTTSLENSCVGKYCMVIKKSDPRYKMFAVKSNFIREVSDDNNDFIKFFNWYSTNTNVQCYALMKTVSQDVYIPEHYKTETKSRYRPRSGRFGSSFTSTEFKQIKVPAHYETKYTYYYKYVDPEHLIETDDYKIVKIDLFTYYKNVILKEKTEEIKGYLK